MRAATAARGLPFWFLAASTFLIQALPKLVAHGLFMDGLWYAVIARNLALGIGSFWRPMFTPTLTPDFFSDHPPLAFGIESLFFRALGDHWWVASVYSLATAVATALLLLAFMRELEHALGPERPQGAGTAWLPVLFWVSVPTVVWSFANNMLENTMGLFVLLAAWAFFRAQGRGLAWSVAAGAGLYAALLCKGVVGLFPLAFPFLLALARGQRGRAAASTLIALAVFAGLFALTALSADARAYAARYFGGNFVPVVSGARGGVSNRLHIVVRLVLDLLPALILFALVSWRAPATGARRSLGLALIGLGLAGSLPIALSPIQSGFYLVPAFPFFALGLALLARPGAERLLAWCDARPTFTRAARAGGAVLFAGALGLGLSRAGTIGRGGPTIPDVRMIGTVVPAGAILGVCREMHGEWALHGYLELYDRVAMDANSFDHEFALVKAGACTPPEGFVRVDLPTRELALYRRAGAR